ncbi:MAG: hypothetical protein HC781_15100 [Leptolyngbyaceae cyanobacterium CSU_1_4]|nr:hypothetical protein [Leptolyngbyaceae cyanobacterium CSU_1_4]
MANKVSADAAQRFIEQISACCEGVVESGLLETNLFAGVAKKIKVPKGKIGAANDEDTDINPFTAAERDRIIDAFQGNRHYSFHQV